MSNKVTTLVWERQVGSTHRKTLLAYMADKASDDGSGVYVSKKRMARECEMSKTTVINHLRDFVSEGLIVEAGQSEWRTTIYHMSLPKIRELPLLVAGGTDLNPQSRKGSNSEPGGTSDAAEGSNGRAVEGTAAVPKPESTKNKTSAHMRACVNEKLIPHCANHVTKNALSVLLREVSAFDGRRVLVTHPFYFSQIDNDLSRELKAAGLKLVKDPGEMRIEGEGG